MENVRGRIANSVVRDNMLQIPGVATMPYPELPADHCAAARGAVGVYQGFKVTTYDTALAQSDNGGDAQDVLLPASETRQAPGKSRVKDSAKSLSAQAYEAIKNDIITLRLRPGEYLNKAQISAAIRIGRTPVHQALNRLALERLVEVIPRKGYIVKAISVDEIMNVIDVRIVNETYCAQLAAARATREDVRKLDEILRQYDSDGADTAVQMALDREFHTCLANAAGNPVLSAIMRNLHDSSLRFWFISLTNQMHHHKVKGEHHDIVQAIKRSDPEAAGLSIRRHIESFRSNIQRYLTSGNYSF